MHLDLLQVGIPVANQALEQKDGYKHLYVGD